MENSITPERKQCSQCHQVKDITEFRKMQGCKDGYRNKCKECAYKTVRRTCRECKGKVEQKDAIQGNYKNYYYCITCYKAIQGKKKCIGCKNIRDIKEFNEDKSRDDGHEYYCKDCSKERQVNKYAKKILEKGAKRCLDCRITKKLSEFPRDNRARDGAGLFCTMCCNGEKATEKPVKDTTRVKRALKIGQSARKLRSFYGISEVEYTEMYEQQNGVCSICGRPEQGKRLLSVDHNHETGKVRALLCNGCNSGLGMFEENIKYLSKAIEYLKRHE
jgi:hypothetical protein